MFKLILGLIIAFLMLIMGMSDPQRRELVTHTNRGETTKTALKPLKVAFVSVYGTACGIATYNKYLRDELALIADVHVFAEHDDAAEPDPSWVTRCWSRHDHPKLALISAIMDYAPDVVLVGHEFGFWPRAYQFTQFVSALQARGIKVVTAMHSVYSHLDKSVQESGSDALIVHSPAAALTLAHKGIGKDRTTIIPHGTSVHAGTADAPQLAPALWDTWGTGHTLYVPGFAMRYKGHLRMLDIVSKLKARYDDIHVVFQMSTNSHNLQEHKALFSDIDRKIAELGLESNVTVHKGFVSEEVMLSHIRTAQAVVLPYLMHPEHEVRGTSGIARHVVSTETPLVVSEVGLFSDLQDEAVKCVTDEDFVAAISRVFDSPETREKQKAARIAFLRRTAWPRVAERYMAVLSAVADGRTAYGLSMRT